MALPFKVFDYTDHSRLGFVWCLRCQDWVPLAEAYGSAHDPHVSDHLQVYRALRLVDNMRETQ